MNKEIQADYSQLSVPLLVAEHSSLEEAVFLRDLFRSKRSNTL